MARSLLNEPYLWVCVYVWPRWAPSKSQIWCNCNYWAFKIARSLLKKSPKCVCVCVCVRVCVCGLDEYSSRSSFQKSLTCYQKSSVFYQKSHVFNQESPILNQKSPVLVQKSPIFYWKSPICLIKRAVYTIRRAPCLFKRALHFQEYQVFFLKRDLQNRTFFSSKIWRCREKE